MVARWHGHARQRAMMSLLCVQAENIILLDLDMTPPWLKGSAAPLPSHTRSVDSSPTRDRGVRKSQSW